MLLNYQHQTGRTQQHWSWVRVFAICTVVLVTSFPVGGIRASSFGTSISTVGIELVMAVAIGAPLAFVCSLGLSLNRKVWLCWLVVFGAIITTESYARVQEQWLMIQCGHAPPAALWVRRWPPYDDRYIVYNPKCGWYVSD